MRTRETQRMWRLAARYSTVGMEMALSVAIGTFGGLWLDRHFETSPYLFWFGLVVGLGAAVRAVVRVVSGTNLDKL